MIVKFKCESCMEIIHVDPTKDPRGLCNAAECIKCGAIMRPYADSMKVIDEADMFNNAPQILL